LDYLTLNNSLSDFTLEGAADDQLDDIDDILDRNMTYKLEAKKTSRQKLKDITGKLEEEKNKSELEKKKLEQVKRDEAALEAKRKEDLGLEKKKKDDLAWETKRREEAKKEELRKQEEARKVELEKNTEPKPEPKDSKPFHREEGMPIDKSAAIQRGKRKATTRNALAELDKVEEKTKLDSMDAKKDIPLEGTKVEPENPKYTSVTATTNTISPNQRYKSMMVQPIVPIEVTPSWVLKVAQERDDKLFKWSQGILAHYKMDLKDLASLNQDYFWKIIEYYEPKEVEGKSTVSEVIDLLKKLDGSLEVTTSTPIKDIWFKVYDQFNKPQYKGIQMQRKIESQGGGASKTEKKKFGSGPDSIYITNQDEAETKVNELEANEGGGVDWVMFYYQDDNIGKLTMKGSGTGGVDEARKALKVNELSYTLIKTFIQRTGGGLQAKIAMVTFLGGKIKPMLKASSGSHCAKLVSMCKKILFVAVDKKIDNIDDLSEKIFSDSIQVTVKDSSPVIKVDGPTGGSTSGTSTPKERSFSVIDTIKRDVPVVRKMSGRVSDLMYSDHKEVAEVFGELKRGNITWIMFSYTDIKDNPYIVRIHDSGKGGVDGFKPHLKEDGIFYICSRVEQIEQISIPKVVLISYVGERSPPFTKSLSAGHRNNLIEYARTYVSIGGQYQPITVDEITDDELVQKITGAKVNSNTVTDKKETTPFVPVKKDPNFNATKNSFPDMVKANLNVEWTGKDEIKSKLDDLVKGTIGWAKFNVEGKSHNEIKCIASGKESLSDEMKKELTKDTVSYFLISIAFSEGGYGMATKYAFIEWIGLGIKPIQKSKATVVKPAVFAFVDSVLKMSADFQESNVDNITRNFIIEKITGTRIRGTEMQIEKKSERFASLGKDKSEVKFENIDAVYKSLEQIVNDSTGINWVLVGYKEGTIDILEYQASGKGGILEFKELLKPDRISCIVYKLKHAKSYQKDFEHLYKYYYGLCHWTGPNITVLEKALASHHWNVFERTIMTKLDKLGYNIQGTHYQTDNMNEVNDDRLRGALRLYD
jgi:hypothetical protein